MDSDGYYWFDSPTMEYGIEEDEPEDDPEESQTESPSLPSLPLSLQEQLACPEIGYTQRNQAMSMKEIDTKLNALRRENFDLKLRLFYQTKEKQKGVRRSEGDSFIDKEYDKYEKALEEYKRALEAKDHEINILESRLEEVNRDKDFELNILKNERDAFASDLQVTTSICKSFMTHLYDVREFWTRHLKQKGIERDENFIDSVNYWLNSSEDLLNSASVLISDEFDGENGQQQRRLYSEMINVNEIPNRGNPLIEINLGEQERREYLKHKNFLYNISSESEEEWSEPDRNVSKSRIGIETCTDLNTLNPSNRVPLKSRTKRLSSSGMSSLGLLSDFSEFIAERQRGRHKANVTKVDEETQTLICSGDLDKLIYHYRKNELKSFNDSYSQTGEDLKKHYQSSQACQTVTRINIDSGIQTDVTELKKKEEKSTETETLCSSSISTQTIEISPPLPFTERTKSHSDQYYSPLNHQSQQLKQPQQQYPIPSYHHKFDIKSRLSPTNIQSQANSINKDFNSNRKLTRSPSTSQQSLFSYKTILTPMTNPMFKNAEYSECEYLKEMDSEMSTVSLARQNRYKNAINDARSNNKARYSSCEDIIYNKSLKSSNNQIDYNQDQTPLNKQVYMTSSYSTSKIYDIINNQVKGINKGKHLFSMEKLDLKSYNDKSYGKGVTADDSENCNLSSPDLGIGDSDQDMNSTLRAYFSLGHYQLLRGNLNQLSSYLNSLDNLYRDCFVLQSIDLSEYLAALKPNLTNLNQIFNSCRNICKNFAIEDENSISIQLEKVKAKKESMEKAITRQLKKTDKLLRKAKLNLKEN